MGIPAPPRPPKSRKITDGNKKVKQKNVNRPKRNIDWNAILWAAIFTALIYFLIEL